MQQVVARNRGGGLHDGFRNVVASILHEPEAMPFVGSINHFFDIFANVLGKLEKEGFSFVFSERSHGCRRCEYTDERTRGRLVWLAVVGLRDNPQTKWGEFCKVVLDCRCGGTRGNNLGGVVRCRCRQEREFRSAICPMHFVVAGLYPHNPDLVCMYNECDYVNCIHIHLSRTDVIVIKFTWWNTPKVRNTNYNEDPMRYVKRPKSQKQALPVFL